MLLTFEMNVKTSFQPVTVREPVVVSFSGWMTHCESLWACPDKLNCVGYKQFSRVGRRKSVTPALIIVNVYCNSASEENYHKTHMED